MKQTVRPTTPRLALILAPSLTLITVFITVSILGITTPGFAGEGTEIWKYDDLPADMNELADGMAKHPMGAHPGFIGGEAFGQIYKPEAADYPIEIHSVELVMASPPNATGKSQMNAVIEIWNDDSNAAAPSSSQPLWTIGTADFLNPMTAQPGMPIQGNTAMIFQFDWSKPENHPPEIKSGNIRVVIRYIEDAKDMMEAWGKIDCAKIAEMGIEIGCGCSALAALTDTATTAKVNVIHIFTPLGECSGTKTWMFVEDVKKDGLDMKGDFVLRMSVKTSNAKPIVDAGGTDTAEADAGSSDTSAMVDAGEPDLPPPDQGTQPVKPVIDLVTPASGTAGKINAIEIIGGGFEAGAVVKVGGNKCSVEQVLATKISATVLPDVVAGVYTVIVENPNGQVAYKQDAFTLEAPEPDIVDAGAGPEVTTPDTTAEVSSGPFALDDVLPACVSAAQDTELTVYGTGFADGLVLKIGETTLPGVTVQSPTKATALAPKGLGAGMYSVFAEQDGQSRVLANALSVGCGGSSAAPPPASGCSTGTHGSGKTDGLAALLLAALALAAIAGRRRSRALS